MLGLAVLLAAESAAAGIDSPSPGCRWLRLDPPPRSISSAAWSADDSELVVGDSLAGRVLRYSSDGRLLEAVVRPGTGRFEFNQPTQIFSTGSGFLVKDRVDHLIWFTRDFEPLRAIDVRPGSVTADYPAGVSYLALLDQAQVGDEVFSFGVVNRGDGPESGFLRLSVDSLELRELIASIPLHAAAGGWYTLGGSVVAGAGASAYGLLWESPPRIIRLSFPPGELAAFPSAFRHLPELPRAAGPEDEPARARALEGATVADGLYGSGKHLYLTTREPAAGRGTRWQLHQIDPEADKLLNSLNLPTAADHILLVPGGSHWAVTERGPMVPFQQRDMSAVLLIPTEWVENPLSGPLLSDEAPACR